MVVFASRGKWTGENSSKGCIPLALGSLIALIPSSLLAIIIIIRTHLEDRTLQKELPGYEEYAKKVKYRLLPEVW